ncbi:MAG: asparagine synthase-related protein, partial [bacterium]|nr:asparagine synthase-related protein [bacterium]
MLAGVLYLDRDKQLSNQDIYQLFDIRNQAKSNIKIVTNKNFAVGFCPDNVPILDEQADLWHNNNDTVTVMFSGNIFNKKDIFPEEQSHFSKGRQIYQKFLEDDIRLLDQINGNYLLAIWNSEKQRLILSRDHLGIEPLYYYQDEDKLVFSSSIKTILRHPGVQSEINDKALSMYLLFNYNPGYETLISGVKKLRPGEFLNFENHRISLKRFWKLSFIPDAEKSEDKITAELLPLLRESITKRLDSVRNSHGAFLSGGMDSSTVVGLMSPFVNGKIHTFSF